MRTGDEWKKGTPYEDPEEAALRIFTESCADISRKMFALAASFRQIGAAMDEFARPAGIQAFVRAGLSPEEAAAEVESCRILAAATGRPFGAVMRNSLRGLGLDV